MLVMMRWQTQQQKNKLWTDIDQKLIQNYQEIINLLRLSIPSTSFSPYMTVLYVASISRLSLFSSNWDLDNSSTPSLCVHAWHYIAVARIRNWSHSSLFPSPALFSLVLFPRASCPHEPAAALRSPFTDRRPREGGSIRKLYLWLLYEYMEL